MRVAESGVRRMFGATNNGSLVGDTDTRVQAALTQRP